jgi:hypothetical protein
MLVCMLRLRAGFAAILAVGVTACGDNNTREKADKTKTITSEFLTTAERGGNTEATTPGTGGFIETPQTRSPTRGRDRDRERIDELGQTVPEIKRAPGTGASVFTGIHRDIYLKAKAACGGVSRRKLARRVDARSANRLVVAGAYASRHRAALWPAAFEGCAVGIKPG